MPKVEIELPQDMVDCVDWLVGRQKSTHEHVLLALLNNAILMLEDAVADEDFDLMISQLVLTMKRYFRAQAPEIWAARQKR